MIVVYCPLCGKELYYSVTAEEYGGVGPSDYPDDRGDCECTYHDDNSELQNALVEFVKWRLTTAVRKFVEDSEIR